MSLKATYHQHGITFCYPEGWELVEETQDDVITITATDAGPFWSLSLLQRRPRATQVLAEAIAAFRDEYDDVDDYPAQTLLNGEPAESRNLEFVSLELINCVFLSAVEAGGRTLFVMTQVTDHERADYEQQFEEITASVQIDPDDTLEII